STSEEQSADVVPLRSSSRAREVCMHAAAEDLQTQQHASRAREEFDALVKPLEQKAGRRLQGPNREKCLEAFAAHPEGFRNCVSEALARGKSDRNPVGLLWGMVRDGDHVQE